MYLGNDEAITAKSRAKAAWLWAGRNATLVGTSASAIHGSRWLDPLVPAELNRYGDAVDGIVIHRGRLAVDEICIVDGLPVTTPARTAYDLGRVGDLTRAVIRLDALGRATGLQASDVQPLVDRNAGARGLRQLREALMLSDPRAESPQETRTRLVLIDEGFPRPRSQVAVYDAGGHPIAWVDMGWDVWKVGVEFDGAQHWTDPRQRARDIDRLDALESAGWRIIRVTSELLRYRRGVMVARVAEALRAAGWDGRAEISVDARKGLRKVS